MEGKWQKRLYTPSGLSVIRIKNWESILEMDNHLELLIYHFIPLIQQFHDEMKGWIHHYHLGCKCDSIRERIQTSEPRLS